MSVAILDRTTSLCQATNSVDQCQIVVSIGEYRQVWRAPDGAFEIRYFIGESSWVQRFRHGLSFDYECLREIRSPLGSGGRLGALTSVDPGKTDRAFQFCPRSQ
jgi:hypothetical protein